MHTGVLSPPAHREYYNIRTLANSVVSSSLSDLQISKGWQSIFDCHPLTYAQNGNSVVVLMRGSPFLRSCFVSAGFKSCRRFYGNLGILTFSGGVPGQYLADFDSRQQQGLDASRDEGVLIRVSGTAFLKQKTIIITVMNAREKRPNTSRIQFDVFTVQPSPKERR